MKESTREYFPMLDVFRIIVCAMVFIFHIVYFQVVDIPQDNLFYFPGVMEAFFILSGFLLYYLHESEFEKINKDSIKNFYLKRILKIYPYYLLYTICIIIYQHYWSLIIIPSEILCIHGFFPQLFLIAGNDGTWFISCIIFSYLLFPFLCLMVRSTKRVKLAYFLIYLFIIYIVALSYKFKIDFLYLHINPIFRMFEFLIGMFLAKIFIQHKHTKTNNYSVFIAISSVLIMSGLMFLLNPQNRFQEFIHSLTFYSFITIPVFSIVIYSLAVYKNKFTHFLAQSQILKKLAKLTLPFYIWQGLAIKITKDYLTNNNIPDYIDTLIVTIICSVITYVIFDKIFIKVIEKLLIKKSSY